MMHKTILLFALLIANLSFAGDFRFPNVEFDYAKLYFFNLDLKQPNHMDFRIYDNGMYAASKIGNGQLLSNEFHSKVLIALKDGIDELEMGLSKCFMPRHGIIYFNIDHEPVASLSICFECDKISVWSREHIQFKENYNRFNFKKAEKQIAALAEIVENEKIPVYKSPDDESKYWDYINVPGLSAGLHFDKKTLDESFLNWPEKVTPEMVKKWIYSASRGFFGKEIDSVNVRNSDTVHYQILPFNDHSQFIFSTNELVFAQIVSNQINLPFNLSVGMSLDEVYQKIAMEKNNQRRSPDWIILETEKWRIRIEFYLDTVSEIELSKIYQFR